LGRQAFIATMAPTLGSGSSGQGASWLRIATMIPVFVVLILLLHSSWAAVANRASGIGSLLSLASNSNTTTDSLDVFQIDAPVRDNYNGAVCQQIIVHHDFSASYGTPFVGKASESMLLTASANGSKELTHHRRAASLQPPYLTCLLPRPASIMTG
jgi:hypothetical protein